MNSNPGQKLTALLELEKASTCGAESRQSYSAMHRERFADVLRLCRTYVPDPSARVLDIGRSELTFHLSRVYKDIRTLGFETILDDGGHREVSSLDTIPHLVFNLLHADRVVEWPECGRFDLIVFSEVIEHLSLAPEYVFAALRALLTDEGVLICTTPNAADIVKRVRLALGRNPYERLRLYSMNPGHFREYTAQELKEIAESVGLSWVRHTYFNWILQDRQSVKTFLKKLAGFYPTLRPFQACILKKMP